MDEPKPRARASPDPVTEHVIRQADMALTKTQGHRPHAAQLLGWAETRIYNVIDSSPHLRAKWSRKDEQPVTPSVAADLHREPALKPFGSTNEELAAAAQAEDALWSKGYEKLNFTQEKKEFLGAVMSAHGNHWKAVSQMFQGGVSYTATELLYMFHKVEKQIQETFDHPEKYVRVAYTQSGISYEVKSAHEFRMEMMDRALSIADMFRKLNSDAEKAQLLQAQIEKLKVEDAKQVKKRKVGAWQATQSTKAPIVEAQQ